MKRRWRDKARNAETDNKNPPRWDGADLSELQGSYGDYLMAKIAKVFPELGRAHLARDP